MAPLPSATLDSSQGTFTPGTSGLVHPREATFNLSPGVILEGGYAGSLAPEPDDRDPRRYETVLSGDLSRDDGAGGDNRDNCFHVVTALIGIIGPTLDGFTISGGNANDIGFPTGNSAGGGLYTSGPLSVINCVIRDNAHASMTGSNACRPGRAFILPSTSICRKVSPTT